MNTNQNTNQEQKKHFLTSHKSIRFTAALCAAATLAGGVAYAATPDTAAARKGKSGQSLPSAERPSAAQPQAATRWSQPAQRKRAAVSPAPIRASASV